MLEPSAGTGLLAVFAELAGARLHLNELAELRADLLSALFTKAAITRFDAAQIDDHLDAALKPSVVLMNPPFSALAHVDRHLEGRQWLVGERYSIADAYLGVFAGWLPRLGERFADLRNLARAREAFQSRPATQQALAAEGQR